MLHKTVKKVYQDLDRFHFNTALASLMEFTNHLARAWDEGAVDSETWNESIRALLLMLAPTAPHLAEELWAAQGLRLQHPQPALPRVGRVPRRRGRSDPRGAGQR